MSVIDSHIICRDFINVEELILMIKDICQTGVMQLVMGSIINKYNIDFSKEEIKEEIIRLTNQLWKLIPMWENNEDWEK